MIGDCKACDRTGVTLFQGGHCLVCTETRDRFASAALGAILGHNAQLMVPDRSSLQPGCLAGGEPAISGKIAAEVAYEYADWMMIERAKDAEKLDR